MSILDNPVPLLLTQTEPKDQENSGWLFGLMEEEKWNIEDALKEAKELIWRVRTLLQSVLAVIFRDDLELSVRRCMQNEDILSTNRTKQQLIDLANSV